jgi:hypothetical protein
MYKRETEPGKENAHGGEQQHFAREQRGGFQKGRSPEPLVSDPPHLHFEVRRTVLDRSISMS